MITPNIRLYLPDVINGDTQKILDKGRVSKYNKKFSNLRSKK